MVYLDDTDDDESEPNFNHHMQQDYTDAGLKNVPLRWRHDTPLGDVPTDTRSGVVLGVPLKTTSQSTDNVRSSLQSRGSRSGHRPGRVRAMNHEKFLPCRTDSVESAQSISYGVTHHGGEHENAIRKCNQEQQTPHRDESVTCPSVLTNTIHYNTVNPITPKHPAEGFAFNKSVSPCASNNRIPEVVLVVPPPRRRRQLMTQRRREEERIKNSQTPGMASLPPNSLANDCGYYAWHRKDEDGISNDSYPFGGFSLEEYCEMNGVARNLNGCQAQREINDANLMEGWLLRGKWV